MAAPKATWTETDAARRTRLAKGCRFSCLLDSTPGHKFSLTGEPTVPPLMRKVLIAMGANPGKTFRPTQATAMPCGPFPVRTVALSGLAVGIR